MQDQKLKRMEYLADVIRKYRTTPPELSDEEITILMAEEITDMSGFLKKYKKQIKKS